MSISEIKGMSVPIKIWAPLEEVESQALTQLRKTASLPWVVSHVAAMPDVHFGIGATVGSVIAMKEAISPAAVGVDIGCGVGALRTSLKASDLPDNLFKLRSKIETVVPVGFNSHAELPKITCKTSSSKALWKEFGQLSNKVQDLYKKAQSQLGTLGGGNHFIELCLDTEQNVWIMLHSGSRNIGKCLAEVHINIAKKLAHNKQIIDRDLAVFLSGTQEMMDYRHDLFWAQRYAFENRMTMLALIKSVMIEMFENVKFDDPILCHHNYVSEEHHYGEDVLVTRKGAISAKLGEMGIIPGSMGTRSYVVRGLGNPESFCSASHGAGRRMSRGEAKKKFTIADLNEQTKGVECRKDRGVLDEIPGAYKDIDLVMSNQKDLVEIVHELKQVMCVKG